MSVTSVRKDPENQTMTMTADYPAGIDQVWQLWADPRLLERWWGPPTYPATVKEHDLTRGGAVTYFMTGPDGDQFHGWWRVTAVDAPQGLAFDDGFADTDGNPNDDMPVTSVQVDLAEVPGGGTRMTITSTFPSREAMEKLLEMGMEEGLRESVGQTDAILDEVRAA